MEEEHFHVLPTSTLKEVVATLSPSVMPVCTASYMMADYGHAHHVFRVNVRL
jgi:hypothetical protein